MLQLINIKKDYIVDKRFFPALKGISISFRRHEFVSILGPSGCGKTTLLNIIGGLDHYTSGNLLIDGKSTKRYTDRDWDIYRNHRIGFIFQAYNLIPHQNILQNVELALTIAGYTKEQRIIKAKEALDRVGLKGMYKKKPNQLSGGQCQRVAIARALVNDPSILLADEPTGALDSKTSVQIMDLIKEISKNTLVIMVTHNPPLAKKYSTRIIKLLDGNVIDDSNPFNGHSKIKSRRFRKPAKAKMSFWNAFKLSARNLISKRKRTALVVVASSIGIVGVSAVLGLSSGVRGYIDKMENDMLSASPVYVSEESYDLASILNNLSNMMRNQAVSESWKDGYIDVEYLTDLLIKNAQGGVIKNDITQEYVDYVLKMPEEYRAEVSLLSGNVPAHVVYTDVSIPWRENGETKTEERRFSLTALKNVYTSMLADVGEGQFASLSNLAANFPTMFYQGLDNKEYLKEQYDVLAYAPGVTDLPDANDTSHCVVVLNRRKKFVDLVTILNGLMGEDNFVNALLKSLELPTGEILEKIKFDDILGKEFYFYGYDNTFIENNDSATKEDLPFKYNYVIDKDEDKGIYDKPKCTVKISAIIAPKEGRNYGSLPSGIYFTSGFNNLMKQDCGNTSDGTGDKDSDIYKYFKDHGDELLNLASYSYTEKKFKVILGIGYEYDFDYIEKYEDNKPKYKTLNTVGLVGSGTRISTEGNPFAYSELYSRNVTGKKLISQEEGETNTYSYSDLPYRIEVYPRSFTEKEQVTKYLDEWNKGIENNAERNKVTYNDNLEIVVTMVDTLVDMTTISLMIFSSLALLVSTVMIGIITYISVMERIKEIGVIRSLGGRKRDVSYLFNAETFIIGAISGLFGVAVTYVFELVVNLVTKPITKVSMLVNFKWYTAIAVIAVSILLTCISGLIPARSAAKQDPVNALRSE